MIPAQGWTVKGGEGGGGLPTSWESWVAHEEILAGTCWVALGAVR